jgi:hypothetical protein
MCIHYLKLNILLLKNFVNKNNEDNSLDIFAIVITTNELVKELVN